MTTATTAPTFINLGREILLAGPNLRACRVKMTEHTYTPNSFDPQPQYDSVLSLPTREEKRTIRTYHHAWRLWMWDSLSSITFKIASDRGMVGNLLYIPPVDAVEVWHNDTLCRGVQQQLAQRPQQKFIRFDGGTAIKGDLQRLFAGITITV